MKATARRITTPILFTLAALSLAAPSFAQTPTWNRRVEAISLTPDETSPLLHLNAVIAIEVDDQGLTLDLGTEVLFHVNGTLLDIRQIDAVTSGGTAGDCPPGFACQITPVGCVCIAVELSGTMIDPGPLRPEDEIMVLLRPAPGAVPEPDTGGDQLIISNIGASGDDGVRYWDTEMVSLNVVPTSGAPDSFFDVWVEMDYQLKGIEYAVDLSHELEVLVNGVPAGSISVDALTDSITLPSPCGPNVANCDLPCGSFGGTQASCAPAQVDSGCSACKATKFCVIPAIPAEPGDELTIILKPAPGALPELPGFEEDEETVDVPMLFSDVDELSVSAGGIQGFTLTAGAAFAGDFYYIASSLHGSRPGVDLGPLHIPLNPAPWGLQPVPVLGQSYLNNPGLFDGSGNANAAMLLPGGGHKQHIGLRITHAYIVFKAGQGLVAVSNTVELELVP